ncbi:hypothetical protein IRY61_04135 [Candidatus Saccharibacteria bacterium]|nr:hypothetical protein [Candidatus Saccharibacteria bacterium]
MTEQLRDLTLTDEQLAAAADVAQDAIITMDARYGTGFPHFAAGEHNLAYHNGYHARTVAEDGLRVAQALGLALPELVTVEVAGYAHDIVQLKQRGVMEAESAEWFKKEMLRRGLPPVMAEAGALAILGTEPVFDEENRLVGQVATQLDYPSRSVERIALSVASGDFGRMLTPVGPHLSHRLYQQIKGAQPHEAPSMEGFAGFLARQTELRENYRFPVPEAERVLATHRREVIKYGEQLLKLIERGDITSWNQVMQLDQEFMRSHAR